MTKKEMEDFINTHRIYPREYKGRRDENIIRKMNNSYIYNNGYIKCLHGEINKDGDFEITKEVTYNLSDPSDKTETIILSNMGRPLIAYNTILSDAGELSKQIIPGVQNDNWNVRDIVSEIARLHQTYRDPNSELYKLRSVNYTEYRRRLNIIYNFISRYSQRIDGLKTTVKHGSKYDT